MGRDPLLEGRIAQYGFVEDRDYVIIQEATGKPGRPRIDYHDTLSMGKELAMVDICRH
jgi:anti-repressor protein